MHDVDEEEKVHSLRDHSEKLAVAYGLLKVPEGMPIRVMKNLRVCGDCHLTIKVIAQVTGREMILRDTNRFHHLRMACVLAVTNGNYKHLITGRMQIWLWLLMPRSRWQHFLGPPGDFGAKRCEEQKKLKEKQFQKLYTLIIKVTDVDALLHPSNLRAISTSPGFVPVEERWNVCAYSHLQYSVHKGLSSNQLNQ
ncbi:hypothetical protein NC651_012238 [Populus alba x Populus x berolinensis]|nr:hypothetical protein NC651_012238 [Populus alba x Populus x berolinensis]